MSDTAEIANALVTHCRNQTTDQGLDELYADDAQSIEAFAMSEGGPTEWSGREAIREKHQWWDANFEVHKADVDGPYLHRDAFSVIFEFDATDKTSGQRMQMKEVALYHVKDGKIAREEFFFPPMPAPA